MQSNPAHPQVAEVIDWTSVLMASRSPRLSCTRPCKGAHVGNLFVDSLEFIPFDYHWDVIENKENWWELWNYFETWRKIVSRTWVTISSSTNPVQPACISVLVICPVPSEICCSSYFFNFEILSVYGLVFVCFSCYPKSWAKPWWPDFLIILFMSICKTSA